MVLSEKLKLAAAVIDGLSSEVSNEFDFRAAERVLKFRLLAAEAQGELKKEVLRSDRRGRLLYWASAALLGIALRHFDWVSIVAGMSAVFVLQWAVEWQRNLQGLLILGEVGAAQARQDYFFLDQMEQRAEETEPSARV
jgi:hypothetical protein